MLKWSAQKDRVVMHDESPRPLLGRRFILPQAVAVALERVFTEPVDGVIVIERSRYARSHPGMCATTRPNRILLAISGAEFIANPELMLHEYFHVIRQWRTGRLTRWRYVAESARCGYWANRYEREAREFTAAAVDEYSSYLRDPVSRMDRTQGVIAQASEDKLPSTDTGDK